MERSEVARAVFTELAKYTDQSVPLSAVLKDEIITESLDLVEFALALESKFNTEIPSQTIYDWITVDDVITSTTLLINGSSSGSSNEFSGGARA